MTDSDGFLPDARHDGLPRWFLYARNFALLLLCCLGLGTATGVGTYAVVLLLALFLSP